MRTQNTPLRPLISACFTVGSAYCRDFDRSTGVKIKVVVHEAEEGGFWAEVPAIPGCASQGETMDELLRNVQEAIEGRLSIDVAESKPDPKRRILEIAI
jgi:predicted RNase H-like HicB family nuclease